MAGWPPLLLYGVIALSVVVENFFPPSPSDVFVVLAAFLSHQGGIHPLTIFFLAWGFSSAGGIGVYAVTRRFGRRFLESPAGRRLLPAPAYAAVEREYRRFGVAGMFLFRLLPGFRAFVAPFAGLAGLGVVRAVLPMVLASGIWFGTLVFVGSTVGSQWETIEATLGRLNRTLAIGSLVALAVVLLWIRQRVRAHRRERMEELAKESRRPDAP